MLLVARGSARLGSSSSRTGLVVAAVVDELPSGVAVAVVQPSQHKILSGPPLPASVVASLSGRGHRYLALLHHPAMSVLWQQHGRASWHAAVVQISLNGGVAGTAWNIAALDNYDASAFMLPFLPGALLVLGVAVLGVAARQSLPLF